MVDIQQLSPGDTVPTALTTLPLPAVPDDLEALLSPADRTSSIVLIYAAPTDSATAIDHALSDGNYACAARALVRSLVVPRILAGTDRDVVQLVLTQPEFSESEPLLLAAAALTRGWIDIAESALARGRSELAQVSDPPIADLLSVTMITIAIARLRGDAAVGLAQTIDARDLMIKLSASERAGAPQLPLLIDYYAAGFELSRGNLGTAWWTLERAAGRFRQWVDGDADHAERRIRADCAGQLSWLDAFTGELRRATRYAGCLLTDRQADTGESGAKFAQLATVWTQLERGEFEQARQRLDHALSTAADHDDPLLAAAERLTQARLAIVTGEPEAALRLLRRPTGAIDDKASSQWFADQFHIATAEAWLAADEVERAIAILATEPESAAAEARLLLAKALRRAGRIRAGAEVLVRVPTDPVAISPSTQVRLWLLQAEVAVEQGNYDRADVLVDRALRTAVREQLRVVVASAGKWLRSFVAQEPGLSRRYSAFLASLPEVATSNVQPSTRLAESWDEACVVPLTRRETQVLKRLAEFCSNEEIAADLVLSLNTVKTHMRSLFQKLSVTRRADAVRRGRTLGLC
jgi:LuxR family transcriptional regulator, maltose regulon positive regulatory protein